MDAINSPTPGAGAPPSRGISVVIAEDHQLMRQTLRALLEGSDGISVCAEAGDLALTRQHVAAHHPEVLVLDLHMPDGSSLQMLRELRTQTPGTHVVLTGAEDAPAFARHALAAGASGYVLKDRAYEELPAAVRAAAHAEDRGTSEGFEPRAV